MPGPSTGATPLAPAPLPGSDYVPGVCNIGPWEIRRRRRSAIAAFGIAGALFAILVVAEAPVWTRVVLLLPIGGGFVSWLQARRHFCVAFAMVGVSNFGDAEATRRAVVDPVQRDRDRRAIVVLVRDGFLLALVPTAIAVVLPG